MLVDPIRDLIWVENEMIVDPVRDLIWVENDLFE